MLEAGSLGPTSPSRRRDVHSESPGTASHETLLHARRDPALVARPAARWPRGRPVERPPTRRHEVETYRDFDVVIAGGTTAAFAAAVASAESGARTALIEPTDWVGGQLTASGVPAVDEAWHKVTDPKTKEVYNVSADRPQAREHDAQLPGHARRHRQPRRRLGQQLLLPAEGLPRPAPPPARGEAQGAAGRLPRHGHQVGRRRPETGRIRSITAIRRTPRPGVAWGGYDRLLSEDLADWYSPGPSARFDKEVLTFADADGRATRRSSSTRPSGARSWPWPTPPTSRGSRRSTAAARATTPAARRP